MIAIFKTVLSLFFFVQIARAEPVKPLGFEDENFSLMFPPDWEVVESLPAVCLTGAKSKDGKKVVTIVGGKITNSGPDAAQRMVDGAKKSAVEKGIPFNQEPEAVINGFTFLVLKMTLPNNSTSIGYFAAVKNKCYGFQFVCIGSDVGMDAEIKRLIGSIQPRSAK